VTGPGKTAGLSRAPIGIGGAVLAVVVAACGSDAPDLIPMPEPPVYLPVVSEPDPDGDGQMMVMTARFTGWLSVHHGCVWTRTTDNEYLVVWNSPMRLVVRDGRIGVVDTDGEAIFDGDEIRGAGGTIGGGRDAAIRVEELVGQPVPPACRAREYWLGGMSALPPTGK
jgi:hypothetical protein